MRFAILVPLLALACSAQAGETARQPISLTIDWNLSLDAQGKVTRLDVRPGRVSDKLPQIRQRLEQAVRRWQFQTGTINGQPAPTDTVLSLAVSLHELGDDKYGIRIDSASTGGHVEKFTPPRYPPEALKHHVTGLAVMHVNYDSDGKVTSVVGEPDAPKASPVLVQASAEAINHWTFQPERVAGHGVPGTVVFPMCFNLMPVGAVPPKIDCQWTPPGRATSIGEGQALALEPAARLLTEIAGRTL